MSVPNCPAIDFQNSTTQIPAARKVIASSPKGSGDMAFRTHKSPPQISPAKPSGTATLSAELIIRISNSASILMPPGGVGAKRKWMAVAVARLIQVTQAPINVRQRPANCWGDGFIARAQHNVEISDRLRERKLGRRWGSLVARSRRAEV